MGDGQGGGSPGTGLIGFHGFKGGVGRTLAAVHMAFFYACMGHRVLLVDADLEAPGLSFWDPPGQGGRDDGLIQLLEELEQRTHDAIDPDLLEDFVRTAPADFFASERARDRFGVMERCRQPVHLLPAGLGQSRDDLVRYVDLLPASGAIVTRVQDKLRLLFEASRYDVVLIDARPGLHAVGAALFSGLVDHNVVLFGPSRQAQRGLLTSLEMLGPRLVNTVFAMAPVAWEGGVRLKDAEAAIHAHAQTVGHGHVPVTTISWHPRLAIDERLITVADPPSATARDYRKLFVELETLRGNGIDRFTERIDSLLDLLKASLAAGGEGQQGPQATLLGVFEREAPKALGDLSGAEREIVARYLKRIDAADWQAEWRARVGFVSLLVWEIVRVLNELAEFDEDAAESLWAIVVRRNHPTEGARQGRYRLLEEQCPGASDGLRRTVGVVYDEYRRRFGRGLQGIAPATSHELPGEPPVTTDMFVRMVGGLA